MDNSMLIAEIKSNYNHSPYFRSGDCFCINDDRVGRVVSFKIYEYEKQLFVDFAETSQTFSSRLYRSKTKIINSFEDFKKKYHDFYNDINN